MPQAHVIPDIIVPFDPKKNYALPVAMVYVRPETNAILYEKAIVEGVRPFARVLYIANLGGGLFIRDGLVYEHYPLQYRFACKGKEELAHYPEMVAAFEEHFRKPFANANIIGAFDALTALKLTEEELFDVFVPDASFIAFYGQTIKKIDAYYVVNYDIPALIKKYRPSANVFAICIALSDETTPVDDVNRSIFETITKSENIRFLNEQRYADLPWYEQARRTYHISRNHVMAMFDMNDFIYVSKSARLPLLETPLGKVLHEETGVPEETLLRIKQYPLVYCDCGGKKKLVNVLEEAKGKNVDETIALMKNVFEKSDILAYTSGNE